MDNKLKSRKFIIACWAALSFTGLGIFCLVKNYNAPWLTSSLPTLVLVVAAWMGVQGKADWNNK